MDKRDPGIIEKGGEASGRRTAGREGTRESNEGFGFRVRQARARPSNNDSGSTLRRSVYGGRSGLPEDNTGGEMSEGVICR